MAELIRSAAGPTIDPEALRQMRERGGTWAAFQNQALDSADRGGLRFLHVGEGCTYQTAPGRYPDTQFGVGWRYLLVGTVNLETGDLNAKDFA